MLKQVEIIEEFLRGCSCGPPGECSECMQGFIRAMRVSGDRTQKKVLDWANNSFGSIACNRDERAARLVEEAIEVAQVEGLPLEIVKRITDRVYSRPPGDLANELGGVGITAEALAENAGLDFEQCTQCEWERVLSKSSEWWEKKHAAKVAAGTADLSPVDEC